jgi:hypothetical protein
VKGFVSSMAYVFSIIKDEVASGTPMQRIIIGGFSQGGCLGIHTVLKCPYVRPTLPPHPCRPTPPRQWVWRRSCRGCVARSARQRPGPFLAMNAALLLLLLLGC